MISKQHKELAQHIIQFAKQNGCSACRANINAGTTNSFEYRDEQLEKLQQASENRLSVSLYIAERYGIYTTNRLERKEVEQFIKKAIGSTLHLAQDPFRSLPQPDLYYKGQMPPDANFDKSMDTLQADSKIQLAKATVGEVYKTDPRIVSVTSGYNDSANFSYLIDSNGFEGENAQTSFGLNANISLKDVGDARPSAGWSDSSMFWNKLQKENIGKIAMERALRKLGQEKIKSGNYSMVLENTVARNLLSPVISALSGSSLAQRNSFLLDKLGKKIAAGMLTLTDDPHLPNAVGSRWFDNEGVATEKRTIVDNGVLQTYFIDTYNARRMNVSPTISGVSVLTFHLGNKDLEGLIRDIRRGILVTGFNGGNSNSASGDFSFGIEGFLIENGKMVKPVAEMNITGNFLTLWERLVAVGNDPRETSSWRTPSLVFDDVAFSGL